MNAFAALTCTFLDFTTQGGTGSIGIVAWRPHNAEENALTTHWAKQTAAYGTRPAFVRPLRFARESLPSA